MLVFAQYIFPEDVHEDRLGALLLPTNTTAADLLSTHCVIQRVMLASQKMSSELNVLQDVIKVINHKVHALSSHQFEQLCEEMDTDQKRQVHWLSKGASLARVFELRELLQRCLSEKQSPLAAHFSSTEWVVKPAYMCDIFSLLNGLNLSLQGRTTTVLESADKVAVFKNPNVHFGFWKRLSVGLHSLSCSTITCISFQKSLSMTSQPQKTPAMGRNGSVTHLRASQVNQCHKKRSTA